jgi:basic amino acid/polyamine antiporter, APA family
MPTPAPSLTRQMLRRRPVSGAPVADGASVQLERTLGTFLLTMFGVGETVGAGIFIVMSEAVPQAGPAVVISFILAGIAAGLAAVCYAEMASAVPVSGSAYSYAYATLGELAAMGVAACLLLEYGVSTAAVAVGWSQYLNKLLDNIFGSHLPHAITSGPWDPQPGVINVPAVVLVALCTLLLIRGASQSAKANAVMVIIKLAVLVIFSAIALTAFKADRFADLAPFGVSGISLAAGTIFFVYIGLDAVSTAGDEVKDPQHTMPRAIIYALIIVMAIHVLVAVAALGSQPWQAFEGQEAVLAVILDHITGNTAGSTLVCVGAVISIFSVTLVTLYGQTRILFTMGRDGLLPATFA